MNAKRLFPAILLLLLLGCTPAEVRRTVNFARGAANFKNMNTYQQVRFIASQDATLSQYADIESLLAKELAAFLRDAAKEWGKDPKQASRKRYVKYTQHYRSRAEVDFEQRRVTVETIDQNQPLKSLREAITTTLLTPFDPEKVNLHSAEEVQLGAEPFLYRQVLDRDRQPVRWRWRAERYADALLADAMQTKTLNGKTVRYVTFPMEPATLDNTASRYREPVLKYSKTFGIHPALVYAVIEVESSFNPYALSAAPAYGLMQIVPTTAGRDSWQFLHGQDRVPTPAYLYNPDNNIEMGTAYLHLIDRRYLDAITNPISREYCMIAAYNTGSGNVLRTFHDDRNRAAERINAMSPEAVYAKLKSDLPYEETRRYVVKVREAKKRYL